MKRFAFITFLLTLLAVSALAQNPTATPPPGDDQDLKISTTLIQIDVTVTDKDGNIVTDLKPEDFEVYENGKKQEITNFSFVSVNSQTKKLENTAQNNTKGQIAVPIPPVKLKQEDVRRTYALVVDDLGLSFESIFWVQKSLKKFINEQMQEGDLVAILRTGSGAGAMQSFTSDKRLLLAAIDKIKYNLEGRVGISSIEPLTPNFMDQLNGETADGKMNTVAGAQQSKEAEEQANEFRSNAFSVGTLGSLNYIIRGMRELPGRKSLMLFSEGFQTITKKGTSFEPNQIFYALKFLADMANRSSVIIYTLDPRGLSSPGMLQAADNTFLMSMDAVEAQLQERNDEFVDTQGSLRYLAYATGGFPFVNQNNLNKGLLKAVEDQSSYYLLGYQPDADTFDPKKSKFNKLEIKVKRPGLKVRYRSGFFGVTDEKFQKIAEQTPQQKLVNALTSPFNASGVNLSLYPIYGNDAKSGDYIRALVYIDAKDLKFVEIADGKRKVSFDIIAMTFGDNGIPVDKLSKNYTVEISERVYQNILKKGFVYNLAVPIKKAGAYQFRIALRDTTANTIGSASQYIEVPNLKKRKLVLSNIILDNFTADEWKKISLGEAQIAEQSSAFLDSTVRRFTRGSVLQYNYVVFSSKPEKPQMQTQMRLIRDGKVVFEGGKIPLGTEGQTDLQRLQASGALTLGKNLEVGNYILQVIVFDGTGGGKPRVATQFIEFEITQ
ncbi:MAG TPA: VWA domain-containing protein [Pyrinomonadaceae bacterium]|jgi:VWFA-related protein